MTLTRQHLVVRPTRHGILFLGILGAMLAGSVNYNNNAGFVLVFLLGGMAMISLFHSFKNLTGMSVAFESAAPVFAGETALFRFRVHARESHRIMVSFSLPGQAPTGASVEKGCRQVVELRAGTRKRGIYSPDVLNLFSVYPFGLFRIRATLPLAASCLVYPRPMPGRLRWGAGGRDPDHKPDHKPDRQTDGQEANRLSGPDDFQGLAPYHPGLDVGRIAWKAVSRGQGVFIKDFKAQADRYTILDFHAVRIPNREERLCRLCHMVLAADRRRMAYGLRLPGLFIQPGTGPDHMRKCLGHLALFREEQP